MGKFRVRFVDVVKWGTIVLLDLFMFFFLGVLLMIYDDNYDSSKGEYWSLASMNAKEKAIYLSYNFWCVINVIVLIYFGIKLYNRIKVNR